MIGCSIGVGIGDGWRPLGVEPPAPVWDPADLFALGQSGAFLDPAGDASVFQDVAGAGAVTPAAIGDPVGTLLDLSGNGAHALAASEAARPALASGAGSLELSMPATAAIYWPGITIGAAVGEQWVISMLVATTHDRAPLLLAADDIAPMVGYWWSGSVGPADVNVEMLSMRVDGVELPEMTRDALYQAMATGDRHVVELAFATEDFPAWRPRINGRGGSLNWSGLLGPVVLRQGLLSDEERAELEAWMIARA